MRPRRPWLPPKVQRWVTYVVVAALLLWGGLRVWETMRFKMDCQDRLGRAECERRYPDLYERVDWRGAGHAAAPPTA